MNEIKINYELIGRNERKISIGKLYKTAKIFGASVDIIIEKDFANNENEKIQIKSYI